MSREDFEQFKEHLENRPEPNFDKSLWLKLEQDLDPQPKRNNYMLLLPSLLLTLLLLGSNGYWFWTYRQFQQKQSGLSSINILQDTIYKSQVYYQYDTIRQTVYLQNEVRQNVPPLPFSAVPFTFRQMDMHTQADNPLPYLSVLEKQPDHGLVPGFLLPFTYSENQYNRYSSLPGFVHFQYISATLNVNYYAQCKLPGSNGLKPIGEIYPQYGFIERSRNAQNLRTLSIYPAIKDNPDFAPPSLLKCNTLQHPLWPSEPDSMIEISAELAEVEWEKKKKKCFTCLKQLMPTGLQLAAKVGASYPYDHSTINLGSKGEMELLVNFRSPVQLWVNAAYHRHHFLSDEMDESQGVPFMQRPAEGFVFSEAESTLQSLQFSLGLQYQFGLGTKSKMRGHLGIGLGNTILMPYELVYDFSNPNNNLEVSIEQFVRPISTQHRSMLFRLGMSIPLRKRWDVLLQSNWQRNWATDHWQAPDLLDFQTGLIYRF